MWLAKEIAKQGLQYYFVATKIDQTIENYETKVGYTITKEEEPEVVETDLPKDKYACGVCLLKFNK